MAFIDVNDGTGCRLHYEKFDNILPRNTLFIHGNLASERWWYPTRDVWISQAVGKHFHGSMVMADFRGCGQTTAPRTVADASMHLLANDFIALAKTMGPGKVSLVGHSTGGLIAAIMLAKAPELFDRAVLLDPVGAKGVKFDDSMTAAFEAMKSDKGLVATVMASTIYKNDAQSPFFKNIVIEDAFSAVKQVGAWILKNLDGLDVTADLKKVLAPVLVLHGEHDLLLPMQDSKDLAALFKNGKFQVVDGQGHCTNAENPAKFVAIANQFLFG